MTPEEFADFFFAFPSIGEATALYITGFSLIVVPWLIAWSGGQIARSTDLFKGN